jgi:hypothetical protein
VPERRFVHAPDHPRFRVARSTRARDDPAISTGRCATHEIELTAN